MAGPTLLQDGEASTYIVIIAREYARIAETSAGETPVWGCPTEGFFAK